jgi:hypothetical protein
MIKFDFKKTNIYSIVTMQIMAIGTLNDTLNMICTFSYSELIRVSQKVEWKYLLIEETTGNSKFVIEFWNQCITKSIQCCTYNEFWYLLIQV